MYCILFCQINTWTSFFLKKTRLEQWWITIHKREIILSGNKPSKSFGYIYLQMSTHSYTQAMISVNV